MWSWQYTLCREVGNAGGSAAFETDALGFVMQVEQLSRDVHKQQGVTISMAHNKGCVHSSAHACCHSFSNEDNLTCCKRKLQVYSAMHMGKHKCRQPPLGPLTGDALCRNGTVLLYTVGVGGVAYVYLRIFKGWRLSDLMYVTRSSLSRSMSSVTAGRRRP